MARMLGTSLANVYSCCRRHAPASVRRNGLSRQREKRVAQKWLNEYENRPEDDAQACPKGGLECSCNKLPDECPHLDWECWDNDFGRYALGELFDLNPSWTLVSLRPARNTL